MAISLADQVLQAIDQSTRLYFRLVILVAEPRRGKSTALREVAARTGAPLVNINLELARRMLDLPARLRPIRAGELVSDIVAGNGDVVLLDNLEILFDVSLKLDPLQLLQKLSGHRTIVAAWAGLVADGHIVYAAPNHLEYRRYPVTSDVLVVADEPAA